MGLCYMSRRRIERNGYGHNRQLNLDPRLCYHLISWRLEFELIRNTFANDTEVSAA